MKKNCQILTIQELAREAADYFSRVEGSRLTYKADGCTLSKEGDLTLVCWNDDTRCFDWKRTFTGNLLAQMVDMPLWEVVMIDRGGFDDYAILFYEQD